MDFQYEKIVSSTLKQIATTNKVVEFVAPGVDSQSVAKVLTLVCDARTVSAEALQDEVSYLGRVNFKLLYLDTEGETKNLDYFADFTDSIKAQVKAGSMLVGTINVLESDVASAGELKLSAVVEVSLLAVQRSEDNCLVDTAQDCYNEKKEINVPSLVGIKTLDIDISDEKSVNCDIDKVLLVDSYVNINETRASDGMVFVGGTFVVLLTYFANDDIASLRYIIPFTEEALFDGLEMGDKIVAYPEVKNTRVVLSGVEGDNVLRVEGLLGVKLIAFTKRSHSVVKDVFMLTNELATSEQEHSFSNLEKVEFLKDKLIASAMLNDTVPAVRDIVGVVSAKNCVANSICSEGQVTIEGVVSANIIYTDENGFNSISAELPYSLDFSQDSVENVEIRTSGIVQDISARVKRDREIEVTAFLEFTTESWSESKETMLKDVEVGAEKEVNRSAVSVFIATENDTIWDVAKALSATPKSILEQNPTLDECLKDGVKVVYFRQLDVSF